VYQAAGPVAAAQLRFEGIERCQIEPLVGLLSRPRCWPITSSAGRLFDGVAALALGIPTADFEAQAAMMLESACDLDTRDEYTMPLTAGELPTFDWRPMVKAVLADRLRGKSPRTIATSFHRALAAGVANAAARFHLPVVLCGGCFSNKVLTELVVDRLTGAGEVCTPGVIPTGDGGLAAGQLAVCSTRLARGWPACA
jgi:hydrogenase maturation protein HypF